MQCGGSRDSSEQPPGLSTANPCAALSFAGGRLKLHLLYFLTSGVSAFSMMQAFRNAAKPLMVVVAITFFLWLVVDLSGITGNTGLLTQTTVGKINGQSIDARTYQTVVQQNIDARQRQSPGPLGLEDTQQVRDEVWEQFVQNTVLSAEYRRRGITVTEDEIAEAIRNSPPPEFREVPEFQTDSQFDMGKYQRWLTSSVAQQYLPALEAQYREQIQRSKLLRVVTADVYLSDAALWERYRDEHEMVKIGLAALVPRTVVPDSAVQASDAEIQAYYKAHLDEFERPATAYLSFVALPRLTNASDTAAARARADSARAEIVGGAPFADVARRESADSASAAKGGDLGEWTKGAMDPAFDSAAFALPLNTVSQPVLSQFGYHIIEITSRKGTKARGRHILIPIEVAGEHRDQLDAEADSLERLGAEKADPAALDTAARVLKLPIGKALPAQEGTKVQVGTLVVPDAGVWAFQAKRGADQPGDRCADRLLRLPARQPAARRRAAARADAPGRGLSGPHGKEARARPTDGAGLREAGHGRRLARGSGRLDEAAVQGIRPVLTGQSAADRSGRGRHGVRPRQGSAKRNARHQGRASTSSRCSSTPRPTPRRS